MTDANKTEIIMIVDRSGSMNSIWTDTVGGFQKFIQDAKTIPGKVSLTLVAFDNRRDLVYDGVDIQSCNDNILNDYSPRGSTALLDTIGFTVNSVGERFAKMNEDERPGKVIVCIITDGEENSSLEFTAPGKIKEMIDHQSTKYSWEFTYLGANQDSFLVGGTIGIPISKCANFAYSSKGSKDVYATLSRSVKAYAASGVVPVMQDIYDEVSKETN